MPCCPFFLRLLSARHYKETCLLACGGQHRDDDDDDDDVAEVEEV